MLKDFFKRSSKEQDALPQNEVRRKLPPINPPGPWFTALNWSEKSLFLIGYAAAMNSVHGMVVELINVPRSMDFSEESEGKFKEVLPELIESADDLFWNFSKVELTDMGSYVHAIYTDPKNANVPFYEVFRLARDYSLGRMTEDIYQREIVKLRDKHAPPAK